MKYYDTMIIGGYGVGNIGDEAILSGMLQELKGNIIVVSHAPAETMRLFKVDAISPNPIKLFEACLLSNEIRIGGGGIFSKYMGPYAKKIPHFAIFCKLFGKKVHWDSIGIYPSTPKNVLKILKLALRLSDSVTVRDRVSQKFVTTELKCYASLVPDPSLNILPPTTEYVNQLLKECGIDLNKRKIGIAPRYVMDHSQRIHKLYCDFIKEISDSDTQIILIPFCKHKYEPIDADHLLAQYLKKNVKVQGDVVIIDQDLTPNDILGIVGAMDFFLATRFHSLIFSYLSGIDFRCLQYDDKCKSFLEGFGLEHCGIELSDANVKNLVQAARKALNDSNRLEQQKKSRKQGHENKLF